MFQMGPWQLLIILALVLILFGGRGRISSLMGDMAQGIKAFRKGLSEDGTEQAAKAKEKEAATATLSADPGAEPVVRVKDTEKTDV